jgi:anthranilate synthase component II
LKILLIDNYDSFTFNIVELLRSIGCGDLSVILNDKIDIEAASNFDKIIISPGPATPQESGNILHVIQSLASTKSILGICLGHQAIAVAFGGKLIQLNKPHHGFSTEIIHHKPHHIFNNLAMPCKVGLYHSWMVDEVNLPSNLQVTSYSKEGHVMSLRHHEFDVHGVQFHPESYMTENGKMMMKNFLK